MIGNIKHNQKGISIIEIVVSMTIFLIAITIAISILVLFLQNPQIMSKKRAMERDMQMIVDRISSDFKNYTLDYDYAGYSGGIPDWDVNNTIALLNHDGEQILYEVVGSDIQYTFDGDTQNLNGSNMAFDTVYFSLNPSDSPWVEGSTSNFQPSLTILLEAHTVEAEPSTYWLQTTVMSRNYFR